VSFLRRRRDDVPEELQRAVGAVADPATGRTLGELGMLRELRVRNGSLVIVLALPTRNWPGRAVLETRVRSAVASVAFGEASNGSPREAENVAPAGAASVASDGARKVAFGAPATIEFVEMGDEERRAARRTLELPAGGEPASASLRALRRAPWNRYLDPSSRTRVVAIASGKGGVGKSTITVNLAVALAAAGFEVGLLDADVYGFSVPRMLGVEEQPAELEGLLVAPVVHGVRCLSMGAFVDDDQPVIWRGPMLHKAIEQFIFDVYWGEPDFLLVDMPPGTGDVTLSLAQQLPRAELVLVTTPQDAAVRVAQRAGAAARKLKLPLRGVVENLSWYEAPDGSRVELFGSGGGAVLGEALGVPLLGQVPVMPALREAGDRGRPVGVEQPSGREAAVFATLARRLVELGPARVYRPELKLRPG
jgi:ATP-binding protein involved in chromosome partitioning